MVGRLLSERCEVVANVVVRTQPWRRTLANHGQHHLCRKQVARPRLSLSNNKHPYHDSFLISHLHSPHTHSCLPSRPELTLEHGSRMCFATHSHSQHAWTTGAVTLEHSNMVHGFVLHSHHILTCQHVWELSHSKLEHGSWICFATHSHSHSHTATCLESCRTQAWFADVFCDSLTFSHGNMLGRPELSHLSTRTWLHHDRQCLTT